MGDGEVVEGRCRLHISARCAPMLIVALVCAASSSRAAAQTTQRPQEPFTRPYRGLFLGGDAARPSGQSLRLSFNAHGGYEQSHDDLTDNLSVSREGPNTELFARLAYSRTGRVSEFGASIAAYGSQYATVAPSFLPGYEAEADGSWQFGRRTTVRGNATASRLSQYGVSPLTGDTSAARLPGATPAGEYDLANRMTDVLNGLARVDWTLSARSSAAVSASLHRSETVGTSILVNERGIAANASHHFGRPSTVLVLYSYREGHMGQSGAESFARTHDLGVSFQKLWLHSATRQTTVQFSVGPSAVEQYGRWTYRGAGSAVVTHPFGRSWMANGSYRRAVLFVPGFNDPFFSDIVDLNVTGLLSRRIEVLTSGAWSRSAVGLHEGGDRITESRRATVGLRWGLSRTTALLVDYFYAHDDFATDIQMPPGYPRNMNRRGLRLGAALMLPLVGRAE